MGRIWGWAIWLALLLGPALAQSDHVLTRAVLADPGGRLTIEQLSDAEFAPMPNILAAGYTDAVHWVRLDIAPTADGRPLILRVRPTYLDTLVLYTPDPAAPGGYRQSVNGDTVPFGARETPAVSLSFTITPEGPSTRYYLRLKSTSSSVLNVAALPQAAAVSEDVQMLIVQVILLGLMSGLLFWAISEYLMSRDSVVAWFLLAHALQGLYLLCISGYAAPLLGRIDRTADMLTSIAVLLVPLSALLFHRALLKAFSPTRLAQRLWDALIVIDVTALLLYAMGWARLGLQLNSIVLLLGAPLFIFVAFTVQSEGLIGRGPLRVVYILQAISLVIFMVPLLGLTAAQRLNLDGSVIPGAISALLMFVLLHRRSRLLLDNAQAVRLDLGLARQQLANEREQRQTQSHFLAMLSHELKTPITVARIALGTARTTGEPRRLIEAALDNMNAVIDRCTYADAMEQHQLQVVAETVDIEALLEEAVSRLPPATPMDMRIGAVQALVTDPVLLGVVVANLLDNAVKYSAPGTPIGLMASIAQHHGRAGLAISIENLPGRAGLPDSAQVFSKFYRSPGARRSSGSGLGLYIVRGIVKRLGGTVRYDPEDGKARFTVWLPR
ncbi:7TM-DISM domain-containing protein [Devosia enhydra]|nr:7TM-DISM domain-containing protein [Devosia enhydra]